MSKAAAHTAQLNRSTKSTRQWPWSSPAVIRQAAQLKAQRKPPVVKHLQWLSQLSSGGVPQSRQAHNIVISQKPAFHKQRNEHHSSLRDTSTKSSSCDLRSMIHQLGVLRQAVAACQNLQPVEFGYRTICKVFTKIQARFPAKGNVSPTSLQASSPATV